jgi:ribose 5-phosphate isomerase B
MPKKAVAAPKKKNDKSKKIILAADPLGAVLKNAVKKHLEAEGYDVIDYGTDCAENFVTYFGISSKAAKAIQKGVADKGIVFCGTGMGVGITANKFKGIYCGLVESEFTAGECKVINKCNMLAMGSRVISEARANMAVDNWLNKKFNEGTPEPYVKLVADAIDEIGKIEDANFK